MQFFTHKIDAATKGIYEIKQKDDKVREKCCMTLQRCSGSTGRSYIVSHPGLHAVRSKIEFHRTLRWWVQSAGVWRTFGRCRNCPIQSMVWQRVLGRIC